MPVDKYAFLKAAEAVGNDRHSAAVEKLFGRNDALPKSMLFEKAATMGLSRDVIDQILSRAGYAAEGQPAAHFAAWNRMSTEQRVKCVEDVGYPTGFAKQWANRDFTSLPGDIKAGLLQNGYFKQFIAEQAPVKFATQSEIAANQYKDARRRDNEEQAKGQHVQVVKWGVPNVVVKTDDGKEMLVGRDKLEPSGTEGGGYYIKKDFAAHFAASSELTKLASDLLKSGAAESDVRNALKAAGCTDENQQREILAAARSYEAREGKTFAAMDAAKWNGLPPKTKDAELRAIGLRNAPEFAFADWDELDDEIQKALQTGGKVHGYSAGNSDTMKPGGKFSAKFSAESFWRGMNEESRVDFLETVLSMPRLNARSFARQYWGSLPDGIKAEIKASYNDTHGYSAGNSDIMKPGGKFSAKFKASSPKEWWDSIPKEVRRLVMIRYTDMNADDRAAEKKTFDELSDPYKTIVKAGYANYAETSGYAAPSLNGPGLKADVVNQVLTNPMAFAADKIDSQTLIQQLEQRGNDKAVKALRAAPPFGPTAWDAVRAKLHRWTDLSDGEIDEIMRAGKTWFAAEKPVLLGDVNKPKPTDSGQPGSEQLPPKPKYTTSLPTDDASKPEVKSFSTAAEAVNYLADNGYINDRSRAVARVEATGKWSAPSGACVERFAAKPSAGAILTHEDDGERVKLLEILPNGDWRVHEETGGEAVIKAADTRKWS